MATRSANCFINDRVGPKPFLLGDWHSSDHPHCRPASQANLDLLFCRRKIMVTGMSAVELAIEKIKSLPEAKAKAVLDWLAQAELPRKPFAAKGVASVRGFARRFQKQPLTTDEWMKILREGEK